MYNSSTSFQTCSCRSISSARFPNTSDATLHSLRISCHPWSDNQGYGFFLELFSRDMFPLTKKSSSSCFKLFLACMIFIVIWKENRSLCFSNRPVDLKDNVTHILHKLGQSNGAMINIKEQNGK